MAWNRFHSRNLTDTKCLIATDSVLAVGTNGGTTLGRHTSFESIHFGLLSQAAERTAPEVGVAHRTAINTMNHSIWGARHWGTTGKFGTASSVGGAEHFGQTGHGESFGHETFSTPGVLDTQGAALTPDFERRFYKYLPPSPHTVSAPILEPLPRLHTAEQNPHRENYSQVTPRVLDELLLGLRQAGRVSIPSPTTPMFSGPIGLVVPDDTALASQGVDEVYKGTFADLFPSPIPSANSAGQTPLPLPISSTPTSWYMLSARNDSPAGILQMGDTTEEVSAIGRHAAPAVESIYFDALEEFHALVAPLAPAEPAVAASMLTTHPAPDSRSAFATVTESVLEKVLAGLCDL